MTGAELKQRRDGMGLSQKELGKLLGLHFMTVSRYEKESSKDALSIPRVVELALETVERKHKRKRVPRG